MTQHGTERVRHESGGFALALAEASRIQAEVAQQAARTVAGNSRDAGDCRELLDMLGLR